MKKKNQSKEKIRNLVRAAVILFLAFIVTVICIQRDSYVKNKMSVNTLEDAFVFQSILLAHSLDPNKKNDYTDISSLEEDDTTSFVSETAIKTGKSKYYIRVNNAANCVTIFVKDDEGNYTVPYKAFICSTGKATPQTGTYSITYKYRWLALFGDVYGQYSTRIVKNILFHSVPYYKQRADTLEYEEYDKLGTTASAGCIRLSVQDAKWIYDNITSGTYVEFYSDKNNPGPLGKPTAQKISSNEKNRNWDPTDPDINNPWNGGSGVPSIIYTPPKKVETKKEEQKPEKDNDTETEKPEKENTVNENTTSTNTTTTNTTVNEKNTTHTNTTTNTVEQNTSANTTNTANTNTNTTTENTQKPSENTTKPAESTTKPEETTTPTTEPKPQEQKPAETPAPQQPSNPQPENQKPAATNTTKPATTNTTTPPANPTTQPSTQNTTAPVTTNTTKTN